MVKLFLKLLRLYRRASIFTVPPQQYLPDLIGGAVDAPGHLNSKYCSHLLLPLGLVLIIICSGNNKN